MNCETAETLILTAEPADLAGRSDSDLAGHLRTCDRCRAMAALLLQSEGELGRALNVVPPPTASAEAARRAVRVADRRRSRGRWLRRTALLAAAAVLAGLLVTRRTEITPLPVPALAPSAQRRPGVSVTAPHGRSVAVLQTDNLNVVVIWFF